MSPIRIAIVFAAFSALGFAQVKVTPANPIIPSPVVIPVTPPATPVVVAQAVPLVVTPSVSLPGHGPAWASSLPAQIGVPNVDPAQPSVWNPALGEYGGTPASVSDANGSAQGNTQTAAATSGNQTATETQRPDFLVTGAATSPKSVADVAREYHHTMNVRGRTFTNADLAALHPAGEEMPSPSQQGNLQQTNAQTTNVEPSYNNDTSNTQPSNEIGGNASGLPQSDQPADTFDASGKPNAGRHSVKHEVEQELEQMRKQK